MNTSRTLFFVFLPLLLTGTFLLFLPGLHAPFIFDDWQVLVHSDWATGKIPWYLGYRPVRNLSYTVDLFFGEMAPFTFHLSNLIYHLTNIGLFAILAGWIIRPDTRGRRILIMGACIVFAVHPVQIESVTYISGRRDLLYALFYLAGLLSFFLMLRHEKPKRAWLVLLLFTVLATGAKESGITLPLAAIFFMPVALDGFNKTQLPTAMTGKTRFMVLAGAILAGGCLLAYILAMALPVLNAGLMGNNPVLHLENVCVLLFKYLFMALWPADLAIDYSAESLSFITSYVNIKGHLALTVITLFTGACVAARAGWLKSRIQENTDVQLIITGWMWFIIIMLPMSNIIPHVERFAVHYLYLPVPGIFLVIWGAVSLLLKQLPATGLHHRKRLAIACQCILIFSMTAALSVATHRQLYWWADELRIWEKTTRINPRCARSQANYGMALLRHDQKEKAREAFSASLAVKPLIPAYIGLSFIAMENRQLEETKELLSHVPVGNPKFERDRLFIQGWIALQENNLNRVRDIGSRLMRAWPYDDAGFFLTARLEMARNNYAAAVVHLQQALELQGHAPRNHLALIQALLMDHQWEPAAAHLIKGFDKKIWSPDDTHRLNDLAFALDKTGQRRTAIDRWYDSLQADPANLMSALNLSLALFQENRYHDMIDLLKQVRLNESFNKPLYSRLLNNIGLAYIKTDQRHDARKTWEKALKLWPDNHSVRDNLERLETMKMGKT